MGKFFDFWIYTLDLDEFFLYLKYGQYIVFNLVLI